MLKIQAIKSLIKQIFDKINCMKNPEENTKMFKIEQHVPFYVVILPDLQRRIDIYERCIHLMETGAIDQLNENQRFPFLLSKSRTL